MKHSLRLLFFLATTSLVVACDDGDGNSDGDGDGDGDDGDDGETCSDDSCAGKGQMVFRVDYADASLGETCGLTDVGGVGDPPPDLPNPDDTVNSLGGPVVDGQSADSIYSDAFEVRCTVTESGQIDINMVGPNHDDTTINPQSRGEAGVEVRGHLSTSDGDGRASISVRTVHAGTMTSEGSDTCVLTALKNTSGEPAVEEGSAAFVFTCPLAVSSIDAFGGCAIRGTVIVEDCPEQ